jgi:hypothetical protein
MYLIVYNELGAFLNYTIVNSQHSTNRMHNFFLRYLYYNIALNIPMFGSTKERHHGTKPNQLSLVDRSM